MYYKNIVDTENIEWQTFNTLCRYYHIDLDKPIRDFTPEELEIVLYGSKEPIAYSIASRSGNRFSRNDYIEGVKTLIERRFVETTSTMSREWYASFMAESPCPKCGGKRLNEMALSVRVGGKNIYEWTTMSVIQALDFMKNLQLDPMRAEDVYKRQVLR